MPRTVRRRSLKTACEWWAKCLEDGFSKKSYGVYKRLVTKICYQIDGDWNDIDLVIERDFQETINNFKRLGYEVR